MSNDYTSKNAQNKNRRKYFVRKKINREREEKAMDDDFKRAFEKDD